MRYVESLLFVVLAAGCGEGSPGPTPPPGADVVRSSVERITEPAVTPEEVSTLGADNAAFAFDLYGTLREEEGNLFLSPYSVSAALAMTHAGAEGRTEEQMATALNFDLPEETLHPAFNATDLALESRAEMAQSRERPFRLHVVNQLFGQRGYVFLPSYLDLLARHYGAGLYLLDFVGDPDGARGVINRWVEDQTEQRIVELIPPGVISPITVLVLTNAIYFNAAWNAPFEPEETRDGAFHRLDGSTVTVPLMHQTQEHLYTEGDGWQAVELRYDTEELSMLIVLPAEGRFAEVESAFDETLLAAIDAGLSAHRTTVTLPRFRFRTAVTLNDRLMALGMTDAFSGGVADFSGIDGTRDLFIQAVLHQAFVSVDEAGTEAAAATAVVIGRVSEPPVAEIAMDRPFLFLIRDHPTGEILFAGRVLDPSGS